MLTIRNKEAEVLWQIEGDLRALIFGALICAVRSWKVQTFPARIYGAPT